MTHRGDITKFPGVRVSSVVSSLDRPVKGREPQIPFRYLNVRNPDIRAALHIHAAQIAAGRAGTSREDWDKLERDLMRRYLLSGYTPDYQYPFFIQVNLPEARPLWEDYLREIRCPSGAAPSDPERREFERRMAERIAGGKT